MNYRNIVSNLEARFCSMNDCILALAILLLIGCGQMKAGIEDMNTYLTNMNFTPRSETVTAERLNL